MFKSRPIIILAILIVVGCRPSPEAVMAPPVDVPPGAITGTVTVEIIDGDSTKTIQIEDVVEGSTLESVLRSDDQIPIEIRGTGRNAFVHSILGKATSGGEGWTYQVDGEFVHEGVGALELTPPSTVTWKFGDAGEL